jgi:hypothetical protein
MPSHYQVLAWDLGQGNNLQARPFGGRTIIRFSCTRMKGLLYALEIGQVVISICENVLL